MSTMSLKTIFGVEKPVIGMLHLPALPGSPENTEDLNSITNRVLEDAKALAAGGIDGMIIENFGDAPFYPRRVPRYTVAFITVLAREIAGRFPLPIGVNVLRNDGVSAVAVAAAIGAAFIRVNVYTGARLTDQGVVEGEAHRVVRYRKLLGCSVRIFADVAVKHSAPLAPRDLADEVEDTIFRGRADAIIVSGTATGHEARPEDVLVAKRAAKHTPVLVGSGVTLTTAAAMFSKADGLIVGTAFKREGVTTNPVDQARVEAFMDAIRKARQADGTEDAND